MLLPAAISSIHTTRACQAVHRCMKQCRAIKGQQLCVSDGQTVFPQHTWAKCVTSKLPSGCCGSSEGLDRAGTAAYDCHAPPLQLYVSMHHISTNRLPTLGRSRICCKMYYNAWTVRACDLLYGKAFITAFTSLRWGLKQHCEILNTVSEAVAWHDALMYTLSDSHMQQAIMEAP